MNLHVHPLPVNLFFFVHKHLESHVAVQPFPLPPLLPLTLLFFSLVFFAYGACFSLGVLFAYSFALGEAWEVWGDENMSDENGWQEG